MLSYLKRFFTSPIPFFPVKETDAGETIIDQEKMSLDERKAWRLEMLRMSVKEVFDEMHFLSGMYRYRVIALDERAHYFVVMVETTKQFDQHEYVDLAVIEQQLRDLTFSNYGVVIDAVYWKANKHINMFRRAADKAPQVLPRSKLDFCDTQPLDHEQPTAAELAAFRSAIANNKRESLSVRGRQYSTDLAPLGSE